MNEGWLWLSILKTTASPSPISTTPAFSPGPQITRGPVVGRVFSQTFEDLYEQCSLHIAAMMPSSVRFGVWPRIAQARSNSSAESPISAASSGVTLEPIMSHFDAGAIEFPQSREFLAILTGYFEGITMSRAPEYGSTAQNGESRSMHGRQIAQCHEQQPGDAD